jgi:hypothetical protein
MMTSVGHEEVEQQGKNWQSCDLTTVQTDMPAALPTVASMRRKPHFKFHLCFHSATFDPAPNERPLFGLSPSARIKETAGFAIIGCSASGS